jgi:hypothetical protein
MKTRNGFVSNSSSSSFVVAVIADFDKIKKPLITKKQRKLLKKLGFLPTSFYGPSLLHRGNWVDYRAKFNKKKAYYLGFYIECNQDDILYELIKARIPFAASCHYGHETYLYDGGNEFVCIRNLGLELEMYGDCRLPRENITIADLAKKEISRGDIVQVYNCEEWLANEKKQQDFLNDDVLGFMRVTMNDDVLEDCSNED